jgi:hypothetical protein
MSASQDELAMLAMGSGAQTPEGQALIEDAANRVAQEEQQASQRQQQQTEAQQEQSSYNWTPEDQARLEELQAVGAAPTADLTKKLSDVGTQYQAEEKVFQEQIKAGNIEAGSSYAGGGKYYGPEAQAQFLKRGNEFIAIGEANTKILADAASVEAAQKAKSQSSLQVTRSDFNKPGSLWFSSGGPKFSMEPKVNPTGLAGIKSRAELSFNKYFTTQRMGFEKGLGAEQQYAEGRPGMELFAMPKAIARNPLGAYFHAVQFYGQREVSPGAKFKETAETYVPGVAVGTQWKQMTGQERASGIAQASVSLAMLGFGGYNALKTPVGVSRGVSAVVGRAGEDVVRLPTGEVVGPTHLATYVGSGSRAVVKPVFAETLPDLNTFKELTSNPKMTEGMVRPVYAPGLGTSSTMMGKAATLTSRFERATGTIFDKPATSEYRNYGGPRLTGIGPSLGDYSSYPMLARPTASQTVIMAGSLPSFGAPTVSIPAQMNLAAPVQNVIVVGSRSSIPVGGLSNFSRVATSSASVVGLAPKTATQAYSQVSRLTRQTVVGGLTTTSRVNLMSTRGVMANPTARLVPVNQIVERPQTFETRSSPVTDIVTTPVPGVTTPMPLPKPIPPEITIPTPVPIPVVPTPKPVPTEPKPPGPSGIIPPRVPFVMDQLIPGSQGGMRSGPRGIAVPKERGTWNFGSASLYLPGATGSVFKSQRYGAVPSEGKKKRKKLGITDSRIAGGSFSTGRMFVGSHA